MLVLNLILPAMATALALPSALTYDVTATAGVSVGFYQRWVRSK